MLLTNPIISNDMEINLTFQIKFENISIRSYRELGGFLKNFNYDEV